MVKRIPKVLIGCVVVIVKNKKILLGKRKSSFMSGYYGIPGGRVNDPEKLEACAIRELAEETGIKVKNVKYLGAIRDKQSGYSFTHFAFLCNKFKGDPKTTEPDKCEGWKWFSINKIPIKTLPGHLAAIDMYIKPQTDRLRDIGSY